MTITRRGFFAVTGMLAVSATGCSGQASSVAARARRMVADTQQAQEMGRQYLAQSPGEADEGLLVQALFGSDPGVEYLSDDRFRHTLHTAIQRDFDCARMVDVDGWALALAEARLCALISLA